MPSLARFIATGAYSGLFPFAPGTVGSLACVVLWYLPAMFGLALTPLTQFVAIMLVIIAGLISIQSLIGPQFKTGGGEKRIRDPGFVVIDEFAGMLIALTAVRAHSLTQIAIAFLLFRIFDVGKWGPIAWCERVPGAWGVMLDDIAAGIAAYAVLAVLVSLNIA